MLAANIKSSLISLHLVPSYIVIIPIIINKPKATCGIGHHRMHVIRVAKWSCKNNYNILVILQMLYIQLHFVISKLFYFIIFYPPQIIDLIKFIKINVFINFVLNSFEIKLPEVYEWIISTYNRTTVK